MSASAAAATKNRAILMMILAISCFSLMDAGVKAVAPHTGVFPALWARYTGQMLLVLILFAPRLRQVVRTNYPRLQFLRSLLLMLATGLFFVGISRIALTDAAALMSVNPVLITLGAGLFLGEHLGPRRIAGIMIALCGALIVIRPGSDVFSTSALFPLAAAFCYSGYALVTRKVGPDEDVRTSLFYTGLVGTVILSLIIPFYWHPIDLTSLALMGIVAGFGTIGQLFLIRAFSSGDAAMLAPYSYCGLILAAVWGVIFFDEYPDGWTVLGAVVIAGAGIYVWHRETYARNPHAQATHSKRN